MAVMRKKERKIKAKTTSNSKFSKKIQRKDGKNKPKQVVKRRRVDNEFRPSWAVNNDSDVQNINNNDVEVDDIMDMVDEEDDLISGYLNSIEKQYERKANQNESEKPEIKEEDEEAFVEPEEYDDIYDDDEVKEETSDSEEKAKNENIYSSMTERSYIENLSMIKKMKAKLKEELALTSDAIMSHPEANLNRLNKLFTLLDTPVTDPEYGIIFFNVQQTVTESLCVIFSDIIPNYRLAERFNPKDNEATGKQKHQLKKDTMRTYIHEKSLLNYYRLYLQRLQRMIGAQVDTVSVNKSNFYKVMLTTQKARYKLACVATLCLSELLNRHYNFNFRTEVITNLAKVLCNTNRADDFMRNIAMTALQRLFKQDTLCEASLEAVDVISELVVKQSYRVSPLVFKTFLSLNLQELANDETNNHKSHKHSNAKAQKKDRKLMSRKERKRNKHFSKFEKEMLEVEAEESNEKRHSHKVEIHKKIFALYFRFVKRCLEIDSLATEQEDRDLEMWYRPLFSPLFEGMAQYSIFLNDVYIYELVKALMQLIQGDKSKPGVQAKCRLSSTERLYCLKTISQILTLSGNLLTIDFQVPYIILYELCSDPTVIYESMPILLECIDEMVIKRFKQLSFKRVIAFVQRLLLLTLYLTGAEAIAFLTVIKRLFGQHQGAAESVFESDDSEQWIGMDRLAELSSNPDLQLTREANSQLIFHQLIHRHSDPYVRYLAYAIVSHYSDAAGRTDNIVDNKSLNKKMRDLNLEPELCTSLLKYSNPLQVYKLVNVDSVDFERIFNRKAVKITGSKRK